MTAWFVGLSTTAQWCVGAGFVAVIVGLCLLLYVADGVIQRRRDRAYADERPYVGEQAPDAGRIQRLCREETEPMRRLHRDLDDTTGGGQCSS